MENFRGCGMNRPLSQNEIPYAFLLLKEISDLIYKWANIPQNQKVNFWNKSHSSDQAKPF